MRTVHLSGGVWALIAGGESPLWVVDSTVREGSNRLILLKKSERIDSTYTGLDMRPIYALQAFLAGQAYCGERSSPTTYA